MKLLTTAQYKLDKSTGYGWSTVGINLSPAREASAVLGNPALPTMCAMSGFCEKVCLNGSGMNVFDTSAQARAQRTLRWVTDATLFAQDILTEIDSAATRASRAGLRFAVRPNLLSDQRALAVTLAKKRPDVQFYDYSKIPLTARQRERLPRNYHITFSASERSTPAQWEALLAAQTNVAMVFDTPRGGELPQFWQGPTREWHVIDGDLHDLRFLDPKGVVVGLRFKRAKSLLYQSLAAGFVQEACA